MSRYDKILFDVDGTLTESGPGIMNAAVYALERMGVDIPDRQVLRRFVGPPLIDSFIQEFNFSPEKAREAAGLFREYYGQRGVFENSVYPGIPEALEKLRQAGCTLAVATAKPEKTALMVLEHFGLAAYFTVVAGAAEDESRRFKSEVIKAALEALDAAGGKGCIMVGDREHDVFGAVRNGLPCLGVLYGYGGRDELEKAGAAFLAETPGDIPGLLLDG